MSTVWQFVRWFTRHRLAIVAILFAAVLAPPRVAVCQTTWEGPIGGRWLVAGNWSGDELPTANSDVVIPAPNSPVVADGPGAQVTRDLTLDSGASIEIHGGSSAVTVHGETLTNDGQILVNSNGSAQGASLFLTVGTTVETSAGGEIVLYENGQLRSTPAGGGEFIHGADHTIRGEGIINANFINLGSITAEDIDSSGDAELAIGTPSGFGGPSGDPRTNHGTIQSSPSSALSFAIALEQSATGKIIADTSTVRLGTSRITGGTLESVNGGVFESTGNSLWFTDVHLTGELHMRRIGGTVGTLRLFGTEFTNDGTIQLGTDLGGNSILYETSSTIGGSGEILMNFGGEGSNATGLATATGVTGTLGADQIVRGVGTITANLINDGTIIADERNGWDTLTLLSNPKINNSIMRADANSTLSVRSTTVNQSAQGRVIANEGTVLLRSGTIRGGTLEATGSGTFSVLVGGRIEDLVNEAPIDVPVGNNPLDIGGTFLENNNTISVGNLLRIDGDVALSGSGEISVPTVISSRLQVNDSFTAVQEAGHSIRGAGQINGPGVLINNGLVEGASDTELLEINGTIGGTGLLRNVRIDGRHTPGESTAIVPVEGNYTINTFARLEIEIGGTTAGAEHDQINSTGAVNLSGTLDVLLIDDFVPSAGDSFTIISTTGTVNNTFNTENLPENVPNFAIDWLPVAYHADRVVLEVASVTGLPGDYNGNGVVDAADYTVWRDTLGQTGIPLSSGADGNGDGDVTTADYDVWVMNFGNSLPALSAAVSQPVPEPGACLLLVCGVIAAARRLRGGYA